MLHGEPWEECVRRSRSSEISPGQMWRQRKGGKLDKQSLGMMEIEREPLTEGVKRSPDGIGKAEKRLECVKGAGRFVAVKVKSSSLQRRHSRMINFDKRMLIARGTAASSIQCVYIAFPLPCSRQLYTSHPHLTCTGPANSSRPAWSLSLECAGASMHTKTVEARQFQPPISASTPPRPQRARRIVKRLRWFRLPNVDDKVSGCLQLLLREHLDLPLVKPFVIVHVQSCGEAAPKAHRGVK
jgi:hypothetical protein